jgi:hypothetical protein
MIAAAAAAATALFTVQLDGVQTTTWEHHHFSEGGCDVPIDGSGSETYRFHSPRTRVQAITTPSGVILTSGGREPVLKLTGTVRREGTVAVGRGEVCSEGDGTGTPAPTPSDCGTRKVKATATVGYGVRPADMLLVAAGFDTPKDPFANCPTGTSQQYPRLLTTGRRLPAHDLLRYGKHVLIARGTKVERGNDSTATTSIRWTATLSRVR